MKIRRLFVIAVFAVSALGTYAAEDGHKAYIDKYCRIAVKEMRRTGVPASITLAQGILESGDGHGTLAVKGNNHFGIKCHKNWEGKRIYHDDDAKGECFRVYPNAEASFKDHSDFLRYNDRYKFLFDYRTTDYKSWAYGLKKAGYATDPLYPEKLIRIIEENKLYSYDVGKVQVESPLNIESAQRLKTPNEAEEVRIDISREVFLENGVRFVYAMPGESYESIAFDYNLFHREILCFNDLQQDCELLSGQMVYIQAKGRRTKKGLDKYIVEAGDDDMTLRDIAQRFGVRQKSLCKLNGLAPDSKLSRGMEIKMR